MVHLQEKERKILVMANGDWGSPWFLTTLLFSGGRKGEGVQIAIERDCHSGTKPKVDWKNEQSRN